MPQDVESYAGATTVEHGLDFHSTVHFKDDFTAKKHYADSFTPIPRAATAGYDLAIFHIRGIRKRLKVVWQDSSTSEHDSTELVPDLVPDDEHSTWPGKVAISCDRLPIPHLPGCYAPKRVAIVQSLNAEQRLVSVRWCPNATIHYAIEEQKPGIPLHGARWRLVQSIIAQASGPSEEVSIYDVETPDALNVTRGDIVLINERAIASLPKVEGVAWLGEVVLEALDGTLLVRRAAASPVTDVVLTREQIAIAVSAADGACKDDDGQESVFSDMSMSSGGYNTHDSDADSVLSLNMDEITYEDEQGSTLAKSEVKENDWEPTSEQADMMKLDGQAMAQSTNNSEQDHIVLSAASQQASVGATTSDGSTKVSQDQAVQYMLHKIDAPADHHYAGREPHAGNLKRVIKEHQILQKADVLPKGVFVISWESRLDLMRVLLIGPQGTPYANAPFVIDFWMSVFFPRQPPKAYFHSWAGERSLGGTDKVNPNLYENGTICLSLLGTWAGRDRENWNSQSSTMLQVIVSLLGLVLVREPYFNEAGYEHLVGVDAERRPSILYNERVTLRAQSFTLMAVEALQQNLRLAGLNHLEDVVRWLYLTQDGLQLLRKAHEHVQAILQRSEKNNEEPDGLDVLSRGACVQLQRVRTRMEAMLAS